MKSDDSFMYVLLIVGLFVVLLTTCGACYNPMQHGSRADEGTDAPTQRAATVEVVSLCTDNSTVMQRGSGTVIARDLVLTAYHVVDCAPDGVTFIKFENGDSYMGFIDTVWEDQDVAVIRFMITDEGGWYPETISILGPAPKRDDFVCVVSALPDRRRDCDYVQRVYDGVFDHSVEVFRGNSGGGVYDNAERLIGVTTHLINCTMFQICGGRATTIAGLPGIRDLIGVR